MSTKRLPFGGSAWDTKDKSFPSWALEFYITQFLTKVLGALTVTPARDLWSTGKHAREESLLQLDCYCSSAEWNGGQGSQSLLLPTTLPAGCWHRMSAPSHHSQHHVVVTLPCFAAYFSFRLPLFCGFVGSCCWYWEYTLHNLSLS